MYPIVPLTASRRFSCPSSMFCQVGELESSKSAMNTLAPEFKALMIILRSTGPVISTRRSEEHTSELQSQSNLVCRLLLEKKKKIKKKKMSKQKKKQKRIRT